MNNIQQKITAHYQNALPFVVYNNPNSTTVFGLFQKDNHLHKITNKFDRKGFVFAPFHSDLTTVLIPFEDSEFVISELVTKAINKSQRHFQNTSNSSKETHIHLVKKGIEAIENDAFKKVVLSRKEEVSNVEIDIFETYEKLLQSYPNAFVYVWFHPAIGLWFGATPETLLNIESNCFTTMALAGTQVYKENETPNWNQKEIEEQQFVTDYLVTKLSHFSKDLKLSETETVKAGSLLHLRTEVQGKLKNSNGDSLFGLVDLLHPTPAVCGLPKETAKQFILDNEDYNRSYYTGFLGEINMGISNNDAQLFVNLRCMEIKKNKAIIYVGGGITKESDPQKEWEETIAKSNIMLSVI